MSEPLELIERLITAGDVWQYGEVIEIDYCPMTRSQEGLDDGCFFCGEPDAWKGPQPHDVACPWIEAMDLLGHPHPDHVRRAA